MRVGTWTAALCALALVGCLPGGGGGTSDGGPFDGGASLDGSTAGGAGGGEGGAGGGAGGEGGAGGAGGAGGEGGAGGAGGEGGVGGTGGEGGAGGAGGAGGGEGGAGGGEPPTPCETEGATERRPCGINDRGRVSRTCEDGTWSAWSACDDPDECFDGAEEETPCGHNDRGIDRRTCQEGQWSAATGCQDPDACRDGAIDLDTCGLNGRGTRARDCAEGQWGEFSPCEDQDVCRDDATEANDCGLNGRGASTRTCAEGQWGDFGACDDPDECRDNARSQQDCGLNDRGSQSRTCRQGRWGAFGQCADPDTCRDGTRDQQACGVNDNGTQTRQCRNGQWGGWGACDDDDVCRNGQTEGRGCGLNNRGLQTRTCANGRWGNYGACDDDDECRDGTRDTRACADVPSVEQSRPCVLGSWGAWTECPDPVACSNTIDDDGDGLIDADDPGCEGPEDEDEFDKACSNGADDDRDGRIDLADFGCTDPDDLDERDPAQRAECGDGRDNDGDGRVDYPNDPECLAAGDQHEASHCGFTGQLLMVPPGGGEVAYDNTGRPSGGRGDCGGGGPQAVALLTLDAPALVRLQIIAGDHDTLMFVRSVCDDAETELACDDDGGPGRLSSIEISFLPAGQYYVFLDSYRGGGEGQGTLLVEIDPDAIGPCNNGEDDDGDGRVDLNDPGCDSRDDRDEGDEPACQNAFDDDDDGRIDLDDPGCEHELDPNEGDEPECQNTFDDDGDGLIDDADPGCEDPDDDDESNTRCGDTVDNDEDGLVDLDDPGCASRWDDDETDGEAQACGDEIDNDEDGLVDWPNDPECLGQAWPSEGPYCTFAEPVVVPFEGGVFDVDTAGAPTSGALKCAEASPQVVYQLTLPRPAVVEATVVGFDAVVQAQSACDLPVSGQVCGSFIETEMLAAGTWYFVVAGVDGEAGQGSVSFDVGVVPECRNGVDDDGDGRLDDADPGCFDGDDDAEGDEPACQNAFDDDEDGLTDIEDPGCTGLSDDDEQDLAQPPECADGVDNDNDGLIDWPDDNNCAAAGGLNEGQLCDFTENLIAVAGDGRYAFDTTNQPSGGGGSCGGGGGQAVAWLHLDAPSVVRFEIVERTYDTIIHLRTTCDDGETEVECDDDGGDGLASAITRHLEAGTYFLLIDGFSGRMGRGVLEVEITPGVACNNGVDDDEDGEIDAADIGCENGQDDDETDPAQVPECGDGVDNDGDGWVDWGEDADCEMSGDRCELENGVVCNGGCVDLQTDAEHCGGCGLGCGAGQACVDGACN